ncbi:hypothetical protein LBMAG42_48020 [Deltaproteobacteria bacterium]|nr:hypothetical protein LBMAG42_48020 [Deltaproteobacteria bacterium]
MIVLLLGLAGAEEVAGAEVAPAEPPDSADLMDRAKKAVAAFPGCFVMRGTAHDTWNAGIFGKGDRVWALGGTLDGGRWDHYYSEWESGTPIKKEEVRGSLFGRFEKPDADESAGRRPLLAALEDDVAMEYVEPEGSGWRLSRTLKGGDAARNLLILKFDANLRPWSWAVKIVDPVKVQNEKGSRAKIVAMDIELSTDGEGAPVAERLTGSFAKWPFAV